MMRSLVALPYRALLGATLTAPTSTEYAKGEVVTLAARPEMITIDTPDARTEGIVRRSTYLGNVIEYDVEVSGHLLIVIEHDPRRITIHPGGQAVKVRFLEDCLYVLPK